MQADSSRALSGLRVLEFSNGKTEMCGRLLADLGAEVILVEPPSGAATRSAAPRVGDISLYFATHNANKGSVVLDLRVGEDLDRFYSLAQAADLLIDANGEIRDAASEFALSTLREKCPQLVVLSISEFGLTGPYRTFKGSNAVQMALSGMLARSGLPGQPPLLPPGNLAYEVAAVQAALCALLGLWQRQRVGLGDHLDFSILEASAQMLDPPLGVTGSAAAGKSAKASATRGRPAPNPLYPIFKCADGYVRICVLSARQWAAMSEWLGPDHGYKDPKYANIAKRNEAAQGINEIISALFADKTMQALVEEAHERGVPLAAMASPADVLADEHFETRNAFASVSISPTRHGRAPDGYLEVDGSRNGIRRPAPEIGQYAPAWDEMAPRTFAEGRHPVQRPLAGIRVLDLGVIVAGAEAGRLLADQGAEVIKVEYSAFPDGGRQSLSGAVMTPSVAQGHRGKQSFGLNLKSEKGRSIFMQLAAQSDVILSNFKPGTLESLGLNYEIIRKINPRIIMADSSALGRTGPQSRRLGYGPLVRASSGLSRLWCYPELENSFSDGVTIYPDHFAARVVVVGVMAKLIERERTGTGGTVSVSQAECFLAGNAEHFLRESLEPGSYRACGNDSEFHLPDGVFACLGDDEWCAISVQDDATWRQLAKTIGCDELARDPELATSSGRLSQRARVNAAVAAWTCARAPAEVMRILQEAHVPAGIMRRLDDFEEDPQLRAREFFGVLHQTGVDFPLVTENGPVRSSLIPFADLRPAPYQGEHTRAVAWQLLRLSDAEIDTLLDSGDLEEVKIPVGH